MTNNTGALVAALAAITIAGCGGGDRTPPPREGPTIANAVLIEKGDAICRENDERLKSRLSRLAPTDEGDPGIAVVAPHLEARANALRTEVQRIEALGRPSTDAKRLDDYLDHRTTNANVLRAAAQAARSGDLSAFEGALEQVENLRARVLAQRFGFKACGATALPQPG